MHKSSPRGPCLDSKRTSALLCTRRGIRQQLIDMCSVSKDRGSDICRGTTEILTDLCVFSPGLIIYLWMGVELITDVMFEIREGQIWPSIRLTEYLDSQLTEWFELMKRIREHNTTEDKVSCEILKASSQERGDTKGTQ